MTLRKPTPADFPEIGRILHEAFKAIAESHGFPVDFPSPEFGTKAATMFGGHPKIFGVVAEEDGRVIGCNFLDQRADIGGVGPIAVDPAYQAKGVGRKLMQAVLDHGRSMRGIRLVQDAFNTRSLSLYASLGFEPREPLALMRGKITGASANPNVRRVQESDIDECAALCRKIYGVDRGNELRDDIAPFGPMVLRRDERIQAYLSAPHFWIMNFAVAESEADLRALLSGTSAATTDPLALLVPIRRASFFRWCLSQGLRVIKPLTLMTMGDYQDPSGAFFPSVMY